MQSGGPSRRDRNRGCRPPRLSRKVVVGQSVSEAVETQPGARQSVCAYGCPACCWSRRPPSPAPQGPAGCLPGRGAPFGPDPTSVYVSAAAEAGPLSTAVGPASSSVKTFCCFPSLNFQKCTRPPTFPTEANIG